MDQLSELDDKQVTELQKMIVSEFETVEGEDPTPQSVDAMTSLADMLDSVRTELKQREAAVTELAQRAAEAATRVYGQDGETKEDGSDSSESPKEMPAEEAKPMPEAEAAMPAEDKKEEAPAEEAPAPMAEEIPAAEAPMAEAPTPAEEAPAVEMTEEEKKAEEEKKKNMTEKTINK